MILQKNSKMLQKNKKIIISALTIIMIISIFIVNYKKENGKIFKDDIIFFKIFKNKNFLKDGKQNNLLFQNDFKNIKKLELNKKSKKIENSSKEYVFNVTYTNVDFKNINLSETINKDTLINGKIAPRNIRKI